MDALGQVSVYGYNNLNRLTEVSYVDGKMVGPQSYRYGYNPEGALTEVVETGKAQTPDTTAPKANFVSPTTKTAS